MWQNWPEPPKTCLFVIVYSCILVYSAICLSVIQPLFLILSAALIPFLDSQSSIVNPLPFLISPCSIRWRLLASLAISPCYDSRPVLLTKTSLSKWSIANGSIPTNTASDANSKTASFNSGFISRDIDTDDERPCDCFSRKHTMGKTFGLAPAHGQRVVLIRTLYSVFSFCVRNAALRIYQASCLRRMKQEKLPLRLELNFK